MVSKNCLNVYHHSERPYSLSNFDKGVYKSNGGCKETLSDMHIYNKPLGWVSTHYIDHMVRAFACGMDYTICITHPKHYTLID